MDYVVIPQLKAYEKQRAAKCLGIEFEYNKKYRMCWWIKNSVKSF